MFLEHFLCIRHTAKPADTSKQPKQLGGIIPWFTDGVPRAQRDNVTHQVPWLGGGRIRIWALEPILLTSGREGGMSRGLP